MRILPSTLLQQQSFNPQWISSSVDIPSGVIIDCQFTTTSAAPIYLASLTCANGIVSISFTQNGRLCAHAETDSWLSIIPMTVSGDVLSATIETGRMPSEDINRILPVGEAYINSRHINVIENTRQDAGIIYVVQDDVVTEHRFSGKMAVRVGDKLDGVCDDGILTISMPAPEYLDYTRIGNDVITGAAGVTSINGVTSSNGKLDIHVYYMGALLPVIKRAGNWAEIDSSSIPFCPALGDILDSYIAPSTHVGYLPLDDLYDGDVRKTSKADAEVYGPAGNRSLKLTDVDNMIDTIK